MTTSHARTLVPATHGEVGRAHPRAHPGTHASAILSMFLVTVSAACSHSSSSGHHVLRVGPLRGVVVVPEAVTQEAVSIDAGTDALTDAELQQLARTLPSSLETAFQRLTPGSVPHVRVGVVDVAGCTVRAGPARGQILYRARCRVKLMSGKVPLLAVETEAIRDTPAPAWAPRRANQATPDRNPLVAFDDVRLTLEDALGAAARLIAYEQLPRDDGDAPGMPQHKRAELARERMARVASAADTPTAPDPLQVRAALFDLRSAGTPLDAGPIEPFLQHQDATVRSAAADALGELCAGTSAPLLEAASAAAPEEDTVRVALTRALARVRACQTIPLRSDAPP